MSDIVPANDHTPTPVPTPATPPSGPSNSKKLLTPLLAFLKEAGKEQLKSVPGLGASIAALEKLSAAQDAAQLDGKIETLLASGHQTNEGVEALKFAAACFYFVQQEQGELLKSLTAQLQTHDLPTGPQALTDLALDTALDAYRNHVILDTLYVDYRGIEGITRSDHACSIPIDDVYVLPNLTREDQRTERHDRERELAHTLTADREDLPPDELDRLEQEYAQHHLWRNDKDTDTGQPVGQALQTARHAVIIGGPGVGKSTLISFLTRCAALGQEETHSRLGWNEHLTPIALSLAAYIDARTTTPKLSLEHYIARTMTERGGQVLQKAIEQEFEQGSVLLLLDGVDEIPEGKDRTAVVQTVEQFMTDHPAIRCIVTSRPYGYIRLKGALEHFDLPNFSTKQIETFVHQWQRAFETLQHPDAPNLANAEKEATEMVAEIERNDKVRQLAANPLMLVIISLMRLESATLPEHRVEFYDSAIKTLMHKWNLWRNLDGIDLGGVQLPVHQLINVWADIAEWSRRTKPTGIIHRAELQRKVVEILQERELDEGNAEDTARSYLNAVVDRAGLLEERGKDIFAFWHPTFEEFLAAVALTTPTSKAEERLLEVRDDPRWREVILLAIGYIGIIQHDPETATQLVKTLAEKDPGPLEPLTHANLLLGADCIADKVGIKQSLAQTIIVNLAQVLPQHPYDVFEKAFIKTVRAVPRLHLSPENLQAFSHMAGYDRWEARMEATRLFSNIGEESAHARALCEKLLKDPYAGIRCHAALGLAKAGDYRAALYIGLAEHRIPSWLVDFGVDQFVRALPDQARHQLRTMLQEDDLKVRQRAALALIHANPKDQDTLNSLLESNDSEVRLEAALALIRANPNDRVTLNSLLENYDPQIRQLAARVLIQANPENHDAQSTLSTLLENECPDIRRQAARALILTNPSDQAARNTLNSLLEIDDFDVQVQAALALIHANPNDQDTLSSLLENGNGYVRLEAAAALIHANPNDQDTLSSLLENTEPFVRLEAVEALIHVNPNDQDAREALNLLLKDEDLYIVLKAADALIQANPSDQDTLRSLLKDQVSHVHPRAARALIEANPNDQDARNVLTALLEDEETYARLEAAEALANAEPLPGEILEPLAKAITSKPWQALAAIAKVHDNETILPTDGQALADLVAVRETDTGPQRAKRRTLFLYLHRKITTNDPYPRRSIP